MRPGFHTVTPYLIARGASAAIAFYKQAFGATELMRAPAPGEPEKLMHSELEIGDSQIMIADEHPEFGYVSPLTLGKSPVGIMLYVDDADATYQRAMQAGAKSVAPMADKEYGRSGIVEDPFGYQWYITTHK
ncbi:MAG: VOC family protein [Bryobacteraceae bacterium]|jgi:PhnB protein